MEKQFLTSHRHISAPLVTLVVSLLLCLQLLLPSAVHATPASHPFCNGGYHTAAKYFYWKDGNQTDYYFGEVNYSITSNCVYVDIDTSFVEYSSRPIFTSWWDHNQYASSSWGTGCPVVSLTGNTYRIYSGDLQAGYYFQQWFSDNGCHWNNENLSYTNYGPLTD